MQLDTSKIPFGIYFIYNKENDGVLGLEGPDQDIITLCVFKTEADAWEYIVNWFEDGDIWDVQGSTSPEESVDMLDNASDTYNFIILNPPLKHGNYHYVYNVKMFQMLLDTRSRLVGRINEKVFNDIEKDLLEA